MPGLTDNLGFNSSQLDADRSTQSDIIDAINRQADQLDSFNNKLSFISSFNLTIPWDGTAPFFANRTFEHNLGYTPSFIAYYSLDSDGGKWYPCSDQRIDNTGLVTLEVEILSTNSYVLAGLVALVAGTAQNINVKGFMLREPAQQT